MVNKDEIISRIKEIEEAIKYLSQIKSKDFLENRESFLLSRYYLQMMLEAMFTIGNQIISNFSFRKPTGYKDILTVLREENIINEVLYEKLVPFAELRSRLVHAYWKISKQRLLEIAENELSNFKEFIKKIATVIKK